MLFSSRPRLPRRSQLEFEDEFLRVELLDVVLEDSVEVGDEAYFQGVAQKVQRVPDVGEVVLHVHVAVELHGYARHAVRYLRLEGLVSVLEH